MNEENVLVITDREELYDKCENMEQLFDKYYLPLLDKHYSKTYKLQQENKQLKDKINMAIKYYELNQQECVIGRNKDEKLIKEYYLPAQCSKKLLDILKEN